MADAGASDARSSSSRRRRRSPACWIGALRRASGAAARGHTFRAQHRQRRSARAAPVGVMAWPRPRNGRTSSAASVSSRASRRSSRPGTRVVRSGELHRQGDSCGAAVHGTAYRLSPPGRHGRQGRRRRTRPRRDRRAGGRDLSRGSAGAADDHDRIARRARRPRRRAARKGRGGRVRDRPDFAFAGPGVKASGPVPGSPPTGGHAGGRRASRDGG